MKKFYLLLLVLFGLTAFGYIGFKGLNVLNYKFPYFWMENKIEKNKQQEIVTIYDPEKKIPGRLPHYRLQLKADSNWKLEENELKNVAANQPVLLTIEIWGKRVLDSITGGAYDTKLKNILTLLSNRENLFIRFNPEMETTNGETPWSNWGQPYVRAFQKFSKVTKEKIPHAQIVWAPAGGLGNMEYYPGKEFFDAGSISLGITDKTDQFLENKTITEVLERKFYRMRFLDVPIIVLSPSERSAELEPAMFTAAFKHYERAKTVTNLDDLQPLNRPERTANSKIGVYDPKKTLVHNDAVSVEHIFIGLENIKNGSYQQELAEILSRNHDVIITLEPKNFKGHTTEPNILKAIIQGDIDHLLEDFYAAIPKDGPTVYLRFAHEMEIPVDRYPWQQQDPLLYIKAFRYVMQFPENHNENIKKVWAPAGDRGSVEWWPGSDVVDYISMSIYGLPDKNITDFRKQDSFETIFNRKSRRLDLFGKPFFIAEFGVKGEEDYQKHWLLNAAEVINRNKEIFGISYFNQQDLPKAWGDIQPPDWSISSSIFNEFTEAVK